MFELNKERSDTVKPNSLHPERSEGSLGVLEMNKEHVRFAQDKLSDEAKLNNLHPDPEVLRRREISRVSWR
jgi:hypothetical protein